MTWWQSLLVILIPLFISGPIGILTWRTLRAGQKTKSTLDLAQAGQIDIETISSLQKQVDVLWKERNTALEDLKGSRTELVAARIELANARSDLVGARADLAYATSEQGRLRLDLVRARERITLLEREVVRLGGNPHSLGSDSPEV